MLELATSIAALAAAALSLAGAMHSRRSRVASQRSEVAAEDLIKDLKSVVQIHLRGDVRNLINKIAEDKGPPPDHPDEAYKALRRAQHDLEHLYLKISDILGMPYDGPLQIGKPTGGMNTRAAR